MKRVLAYTSENRKEGRMKRKDRENRYIYLRVCFYPVPMTSPERDERAGARRRGRAIPDSLHAYAATSSSFRHTWFAPFAVCMLGRRGP